MSIRITDEAKTSDTTHSTRPAGDGWTVTWLPGRVLTRNQATTAMVLAETVAGDIGDHTDKQWLFIEGWADELGMTGTYAVGKISFYGTNPEAGEWTRTAGTVAPGHAIRVPLARVSAGRYGAPQVTPQSAGQGP